MTKPMVLIVEDEEKLAQLEADYCHHAGFDSYCLHDGSEVIDFIKQHHVDAVILDIMLPVKDGITLCKEIRGFSDVPIVMVTAKIEEVDRLLGLEIGADDYICKPFSPKELIARIKTILRRVNKDVLQQHILSVNPETLEANVNGHVVPLTLVEMRILKLLVESPEKILSRNKIMDNIYDDHRIVSDRTIDSHVKKLRHKIAPYQPYELIHSVYGAGYKFSSIASE